MTLALMQPYAFPYLGYFQLMGAVDRFVLLDDVNYINAGWINRNRLMGSSGPLRFTLPIEGASQNRRLGELQLVSGPLWQDKLLRTIEQSYSRSPGFAHAWPVVEAVLRFPERRLTDWLRHSLERVCAALGVNTPMVSAAAVHPAGAARGQRRVVEICLREGATDYVNSDGGRALYTPDAFANEGVRLHFLTHHPRPYPQRGAAFVERLSIIDVMMSNPRCALPGLLGDYSITPADAGPSLCNGHRPWLES
jgi:hypothetical protein